jgi:NADH dehydrogenase [ubiquinone] 1 alpha subcomplex assembly factor 1
LPTQKNWADRVSPRSVAGVLSAIAAVMLITPTAALASSSTKAALSTTTATASTSTPVQSRLFEFDKKELVWSVINDGVMGGVSQSSIVYKNGIATFSGRVRLENNGGFASVRSTELTGGVNAAGKAFRIRVKGDGTTYQFTVSTTDGWFWASITPKKAVWSELAIPFSSLVPKSRFGETVQRPALIFGASVESIGVLIGNKRDQRFSLAIDWIESTA